MKESKSQRTIPKKKAIAADAGNAGKGNGFASVAIRFIDALYDLAQTGNLIGIIIFAFVCWVFYVTYKYWRLLISENFCFFSFGFSPDCERYYQYRSSKSLQITHP